MKINDKNEQRDAIINFGVIEIKSMSEIMAS